MKYFALVLLATAAHAAPRIGSSEPWPDVDDACYQMDKTCEIRKRKADILGNCFCKGGRGSLFYALLPITQYIKNTKTNKSEGDFCRRRRGGRGGPVL